MSREERRNKRVDQHRLKKWNEVTNRKAIFDEMNDAFLKGTFHIDRDLDFDDYFRNTPLFQSELARYLATFTAIEAEFQDPDGVDELVQLAKSTELPIIETLPIVLEAVAETSSGDIITISEHNIEIISEPETITSELKYAHDSTIIQEVQIAHNFDVIQPELQKLNLAVAEQLNTLPTELQLEITSYLSCAEKIILKAHLPDIAIERCNYGKQLPKVQISLDQRRKRLVYDKITKEKLYLKVEKSICYQDSPNYDYPPPYALEYYSASSYNFDYDYGHDIPKQRRYARGCICNTLLFSNPSLLRERSIIRSLTMSGIKPPDGDHISLWLSNGT